MGLCSFLCRGAAVPTDVDLPIDGFVVIQRTGGIVIAELVVAPEERFENDEPRMWQLRVFVWAPRGRRWICTGWSKGLWHADRREYFIADLEVFPRHRDRGYGTRLLLACVDTARRLDAGTVTGNLSDVDDVDRLTRWYRRFGFDVQRSSTQPGIAANIPLRM